MLTIHSDVRKKKQTCHSDSGFSHYSVFSKIQDYSVFRQKNKRPLNLEKFYTSKSLEFRVIDLGFFIHIRFYEFEENQFN